MKKLFLLFAAILMASTGLWAETVDYLYPVYNTDGVPTSGIKEWKTASVDANVVTDAAERVTWNAGWYVVTGKDVTLSQGAICAGNVNLILADGAKLTANGIRDFINQFYTPGIQVSGDGNSLTIYGQTAQSGQLEANGGRSSAGIGGGKDVDGHGITINGGMVTANGGYYAAGIGGGYNASGHTITINGGTVTATSESSASGIGCGGNSLSAASDIFVATNLIVKADGYNPPITVIENNGGDLASSLEGKQYVIIKGSIPTVSASYVYPVYKTIDVAKGVKEWKTGTKDAYEVKSSTDCVTLGEAGTTTWYVVTGEDVILSKGAICAGDVNLILADGAKLTATGADDKAGITTIADAGNSLTIYGQTAQSGQLEATGGIHGAGIGGGNNGTCAEFTINGGTITANGGDGGSGIGGGYYGCGTNITINGGKVTATGINATGIGGGGGYYGIGDYITVNGGTVTANGGTSAAGIGGGNQAYGGHITINSGTVTANGGDNAAGIGGGSFASGNNITINGGTVTANGGESAAGIGGGNDSCGEGITINGGTVTANGGIAASAIGSGHGKDNISNFITVATTHIVKADGNNPPTTVIENTGDDLALSLAGKQYATITEPYFNITANQDHDHETYYYSTFYSRTCDYQVPSGVTAYTGAVDGDVLRLAAIADGIIPAGEAVILKLISEEDITATKQQFDLTAKPTSATKIGNNDLKGTDAEMTLGTNDYALSLGQDGVGFYLWEGKSIGAHKAYLTLTSDAKVLTFEFDDVPSGIEEVQGSKFNVQGASYNLNGMMVGDKYKGIVIQNGKKYLRR